MDRAYALLEIKAVEPARRSFSGIASTPELDREGDIVDPAGVTFRNPLPLLFHHDPKQPIGTRHADGDAGRDSVRGDAADHRRTRPAEDRVDEAWQSHQGRRDHRRLDRPPHPRRTASSA